VNFMWRDAFDTRDPTHAAGEATGASVSRSRACGWSLAWFFAVALGLWGGDAVAGVIIPAGISGGARWDAAPRILGGNERSLDGGLRFSVQGGSYQAFRDSFAWMGGTPSLAAFQQAVEQAFAAWTIVDPVSNLGTSISFVSDFNTPVAGGSSFGGINPNGAEIDLLAFDTGDSFRRALTSIVTVDTPVTLTSGVANYSGSSALAGVDLYINSNPGAQYTLDAFRRLLSHELGHALGLGDVDLGFGNPEMVPFIDDNYNPANPAATLSNSWANLVNPLDPANSPGLSLYSIPPSVFAMAGVNLLMESNGLGISAGNPITNLFPLTNDEFGTRQFLYPIAAVPEPTSLSLVILGGTGVWWRVRRRWPISRRGLKALGT
jgi:hypothetical protein